MSRVQVLKILYTEFVRVLEIILYSIGYKRKIISHPIVNFLNTSPHPTVPGMRLGVLEGSLDFSFMDVIR